MSRSTPNDAAPRAARWRRMNSVTAAAVTRTRRGAAMESSRVSLAAVVVAGRHPQRQPGPRSRIALQYRDRVEPDRGEYAGRAPGPAGGAPPSAQIHVGMVQGAVYDAVNATTPKHFRPYLLDRRFSARASQEAAVATAAYEVLNNIVSTVPNIADGARATVLATLLSQYNASVNPIPDSRSRRRASQPGTPRPKR